MRCISPLAFVQWYNWIQVIFACKDKATNINLSYILHCESLMHLYYLLLRCIDNKASTKIGINRMNTGST